MLDYIHKNILYTITYYDVVDYPLTAFEVWKYLIANEDTNDKMNKSEYVLGEIMQELESEEVKEYIEQYQGFYFLKGGKKLVEKRLKRNKISEAKFKIIKKIVFWLRFAPFLRMILITGRMAMKNTEKRSDLDFLIAVKGGRIFTGRLFITIITQILGKRRYGKKITNRACLNYFVTDKSLQIGLQDLFSAREYSFAYPVFGEDVFLEFQKANGWIRNFEPNFTPAGIMSNKIYKDSHFTAAIRKLGELILNFDFLEKALKKWQMERIMSDRRTYQKGSGVMASDDALIFLPDPQGPKIFAKFKKKLVEVGME